METRSRQLATPQQQLVHFLFLPRPPFRGLDIKHDLFSVLGIELRPYVYQVLNHYPAFQKKTLLGQYCCNIEVKTEKLYRRWVEEGREGGKKVQEEPLGGGAWLVLRLRDPLAQGRAVQVKRLTEM